MEDVFFGVDDHDSRSQFDFCSFSQLEFTGDLWTDPWKQFNSVETNQVNNEKSPSYESDSGLSSVFSLGSPQTITSNISSDKIFSNNSNMSSTEEWLENEMDFFSALLSDEESNDKAEEISETLPHLTEKNMDVEQTYVSRPTGKCCNEHILKEPSGDELPDTCSTETAPRMTLRQRLPVRKATLTTPVERRIPSTFGTKVQVLRVVTPVSSGKPVSTDDVMKAIDDKNRKNAEHAKVNREKKKSYIKGLESEVESVKSANFSLKKESQSLRNERDALRDEVEYLKSVLVNESTLSSLLKKIPTVKNVQLTSSFNSRKRSASQDHDYGESSKKSRTSAGICLHVDKETVSLEFCPKCSKMATQCDEQD